MGTVMTYNYRGGMKIDYSRCKGCGICYDVCPMDIFGFDPKSKLVTVDYPDECWYCGSCIYDCPADALEMDLPLACL